MTADWTIGTQDAVGVEEGEDDIAPWLRRTGIETGKPLSERKLGQMFGMTYRRWACSCIAEALHSLVTSTTYRR